MTFQRYLDALEMEHKRLHDEFFQIENFSDFNPKKFGSAVNEFVKIAMGGIMNIPGGREPRERIIAVTKSFTKNSHNLVRCMNSQGKNMSKEAFKAATLEARKDLFVILSVLKPELQQANPFEFEERMKIPQEPKEPTRSTTARESTVAHRERDPMQEQLKEVSNPASITQSVPNDPPSVTSLHEEKTTPTPMEPSEANEPQIIEKEPPLQQIPAPMEALTTTVESPSATEVNGESNLPSNNEEQMNSNRNELEEFLAEFKGKKLDKASSLPAIPSSTTETLQRRLSTASPPASTENSLSSSPSSQRNKKELCRSSSRRSSMSANGTLPKSARRGSKVFEEVPPEQGEAM